MTQPAVNPFQDWIDRYYDDPVLFVQEVFGHDPEPWQKEGLEAIALGERRISVRSGHGVGKSTFASWASAWFFLTRYTCKVVITAPTSAQLFDALFAELKGQLRNLPDQVKALFDIQSERIVLLAAPEEVFISARTSRAEQPEAMQGVHADNVMLIADEASGVPEAVFEAAVGSMSGHNAVTILLGNPTQSSGLFFDTHHKLKDQWFTLHVSCLDVPNRVSAEFIREVAETYGEHSNAYRIRVLGEFPKGDDDTVIPLEDLESAKLRDIRPSPNSAVVWGLDCARFGNDRTVLTKRKGPTLMEAQKERRNYDTMQTAGWIVDEWNSTPSSLRPVEICVDVIGIGSGVADRLRELGLPIVDVNVSESPSFSEKYTNLRAELWFKGSDWFKAKKCSISEGSHALVNELAMVRFRFTSNGKRQVESKDDIKKRTRDKSSPDLADSFLLTFAGTTALSVQGAAGSKPWSKPIRRNASRAAA